MDFATVVDLDRDGVDEVIADVTTGPPIGSTGNNNRTTTSAVFGREGECGWREDSLALEAFAGITSRTSWCVDESSPDGPFVITYRTFDDLEGPLLVFDWYRYDGGQLAPTDFRWVDAFDRTASEIQCPPAGRTEYSGGMGGM